MFLILFFYTEAGMILNWFVNFEKNDPCVLIKLFSQKLRVSYHNCKPKIIIIRQCKRKENFVPLYGSVFHVVLSIMSYDKKYWRKQQRWSPWGRPWPRGHILKPLALASKPQVLGLGLEALGPRKLHLSSARGQHYFLNRWNFVGKRQKPSGKFANTFFVFRNWSI